MGFGSMLKDYLKYHKISQKDFALRLGISVKHLNEILNNNSSLSKELMLAISMLTNIDVNLIFYVENKKRIQEYLQANFKTPTEIKNFLDSFYLNELAKNNWLTLKDKTSVTQNTLDLLEFLNIKDFSLLNNYLSKKVLYKKNDDANLRKIFLWIKHCDQLINTKSIKPYTKTNLDLLLKDLEQIRNQPFNVQELVELFNNYGIYLVIEDALPKTKVRGCMMLKDNNPAIYITKYFKEKSSFYYTLYHEIGHIKSDYNKAKNKIIIEDSKNEERCNAFALNAMINENIWQKILHNMSQKDQICKDNNIPLCFLYSRLAYAGLIKYSSKEYNSHKEPI